MLGGPPFDFQDARFHLHTVTIKPCACSIHRSSATEQILNSNLLDVTEASVGRRLISAAYLAMAVEAAAQFAEDTMLGGPPFDFQDARFHHVFEIPGGIKLDSILTTWSLIQGTSSRRR
jgi:hypothetical protein